MSESLFSRFRNAWNLFRNGPQDDYTVLGPSSSIREDRVKLKPINEKTTINAIFNRIALDVSQIKIRHVHLDDQGRYLEDAKSTLNDIFSVEANIDQTARAHIQDIVLSMFGEGVVADVPIDTDDEPDEENNPKIYTIRTAKIVSWYPKHIKVNVYNDETGHREDKTVLKNNTAIIENPLYSVVNEPNSTLKRLIRKLCLLDEVDEQASSGKLDLIIQLPYVIKSDLRKKQAEDRRKDIEDQLSKGKYGIAYTDGTEKITQLNRPVENNLLAQIESLTNKLYSEMGITQEIMNGTAKEETMTNYYNRTIEPIASAIVDEYNRKFLTKEARSKGNAIIFTRDPFQLIPISKLADIAYKFTSSMVMSSNEIRQKIGLKPSDQPEADQLSNPNLNPTGGYYPTEESYPEDSYNTQPYEEEE